MTPTDQLKWAAGVVVALTILGTAGSSILQRSSNAQLWVAQADTTHEQTKINAQGIQVLKEIHIEENRRAQEKEYRRLDRETYDKEQCALGNNPKPEQPKFCERYSYETPD